VYGLHFFQFTAFSLKMEAFVNVYFRSSAPGIVSAGDTCPVNQVKCLIGFGTNEAMGLQPAVTQGWHHF